MSQVHSVSVRSCCQNASEKQDLENMAALVLLWQIALYVLRLCSIVLGLMGVNV